MQQLNLAKNLVDITRILTQNPTFEHQGIGLARRVADITVTYNALIRIEPQNGAAHGQAREMGNPHVCYLQLRRLRAGVDVRFRYHETYIRQSTSASLSEPLLLS